MSTGGRTYTPPLYEIGGVSGRMGCPVMVVEKLKFKKRCPMVRAHE